MRIGQVAIALATILPLSACAHSGSPTAPEASSAALQANGITGTSGPVTARAMNDQEVPFKGRFEGAFTVNGVTPPLVSETIEATGNGTQIGRFTLEVPHTINPSTHALTGTYRFIAANGDTLTASFTGHSTPAGPGVLSVVDIATITGGTGRFAGAIGSFTVQRIVTLASSVITGSFDGSISPVGANKQ